MERGSAPKFLKRIISRLRGERFGSHFSLLSRSSAKMSREEAASSPRAEAPGAPGTPQTPGVPHTPQTPVTPGTPSTPEATATPEVAARGSATSLPSIDMRYGGQCLTVQQLPAFCEQLHDLVRMVRNIQSYAAVTGEYPRELERRLAREAAAAGALAAEARHARDVIERARVQRRAVRAARRDLAATLTQLRETESRELECAARAADRKLLKQWESLRDAADPAALDALLDDARTKQSALEALVRLVEARRAALARAAAAPRPDRDDSACGRRRGGKRRRRETRSAPLAPAGPAAPAAGSAGPEDGAVSVAPPDTDRAWDLD